MSPPNKLVEVAAEALIEAGVFDELASGSADDLARAALVAAFAALPECEEVHLPPPADALNAYHHDGWRACITHLVREFGEA